VIVPRTFSGDLASSTELIPRQAHLQVATNDANNYIAHTIANQVSSTAANQLLLGFSTIHSEVTRGSAAPRRSRPESSGQVVALVI